jgi:RimJ/RimL family protein N-acetyltransferase
VRPAEPPIEVRLVVADPALLEAAIDDPATLGHALDAEVADGWAVFPEALPRERERVAADPGGPGWGMRLFVLDEPRILVGFGGFKGPPREGVVELGYAVAPEWEGRGVATAAARELAREAFGSPDVRTVVAHTRPEPGASSRVLEKVGFLAHGEVPDAGIGTAWRFVLSRDRFESSARGPETV